MAKKATKKRARKPRVVKSDDIYQVSEPAPRMFSTGCTLLDCVLGGGWAYRRMANIVGDRSTGKTLLAIEACANFEKENPDGRIVYCEAEAAFDADYAEALGLPRGKVEFPEGIDTVEDFFELLQGMYGEDRPTLLVIDSLDALSDRDELKRDIDKGSFGQNKQKKISEMFRREVRKLYKSNITLIVVSQVRDAIGVQFGEKLKRSGGRAMDFYATHTLWLSNLGQVAVTRKKIKRTIGVKVKARCKKNKISAPYRECEFPLIFEFGVEDLEAGVDWLISVKRTDSIGLSEDKATKLRRSISTLSDEKYDEYRQIVSDAVKEVWADIERDFKPKRRKYR